MLHQRLATDCHQLGDLACGVLLLHRNASLPWFILVPNTDCTALYLMPDAERVLVEKEWNKLAAWVHQKYECDRVNTAAIGNLVPQLHLHTIARHKSDPAWPGVVWGHDLPPAQWEASDLAAVRAELQLKLGLNVP